MKWRETVWPREHGSWSLALEPLAFGLLIAPSVAGGCLALAGTAAFFARQPLRSLANEKKADRRADAWIALLTCATVASVFFAGALLNGGVAWLGWLLPAAFAGGIFLYFDLRGGGREGAAEIAGAAAFASLPAAIAALAQWEPADAAAVAAVMLGRAVPTVLCVRACLRGGKTGQWRIAPAFLGAAAALLIAFALAGAGRVPVVAVALLGLLFLRTIALLVFPRPGWRARTIGIGEAVAGVLFVVIAATAWRA